jgi:hypothetical protein
MRKNLVISIGIFFSLAASRFIPHPPNFTSLIALSFYVPAILGLRYLPVLLISFVITDLIIGYHSLTHWTWGSVLLIGIFSNFFISSIVTRLCGALFGALLFYIITNFGVWVSGAYGYSLSGFITCYVLAIPFFGYNLISTIVFSSLIEAVYKFFNFEARLS